MSLRRNNLVRKGEKKNKILKVYLNHKKQATNSYGEL